MQYGAALLAAPIFCLLYREIFGHQTEDLFWLLNDGWSLFFLIFFYPIIEELAFRGVVQEYLEEKTKQRKLIANLSIANLLTSILFSLMHFIHHAPLWAALTFFPSLVFGYFKERYSGIMPSIILHIFYNLCYFSLIGN
ncbi:MAG: JDVT-CTERM system glutamic-type intramembrane protease [Sulfurimonas sp.]